MKKENSELCSINIVNREKVELVKKDLPENNKLTDIAEVFKVLAIPTRLQLVLALSNDEMCVCDLTALTNVSASAISHQLRVLRNMKFVKFRKEGKMVIYSLDDQYIKNLVEYAFEHTEE